jgi:hypothetical protein
MDNRIKITEETLNNIFDQEAKNIVGKCMKRFELSENKDEIKKQLKEVLYEFMRDLKNIIRVTGKESIRLENTQK